MRPLDGYRIVMAAPRLEATSRARASALERAGAAVRSCVLGESLWVELSDSAADIIVFIAERGVREALLAYEQLAVDARTRDLPVLLLTDVAPAPSARAAVVLSPECEDERLVQTVSGLVAPWRRLNEVEQQLRQQLVDELARSERYARERSDLAHEVRAMLGAIMGFGCNLRDEITGPLTSDQRTHVAKILEAVERATRVLQRRPTGTFVPISSPGRTLSVRPPRPSPSGPPRAQRSLVNLSRIAAEIVDLFEGVAARRSLSLRVELDETVAIWGDALKLKQVVSNLVVNSLKYTPERGWVRLRVQWLTPMALDGAHGRRSAEIVVTDSGDGIPLSHRETIFQRGFRLERHDRLPGEGIGLSVVREIVLQHGGTVAVEGEEGQGATFRVCLPQDRRQRARSGALLMHEGAVARALVDELVAADPPFGQLLTPEQRDSFIERARSCRAVILLASEEELCAALAHWSDAEGSADEGDGL
jgi:signal transduction histidine kinase